VGLWAVDDIAYCVLRFGWWLGIGLGGYYTGFLLEWVGKIRMAWATYLCVSREVFLVLCGHVIRIGRPVGCLLLRHIRGSTCILLVYHEV
jgi:hypothetical protein